MKIIYEGGEIFQLLFDARRCTHYIVNVALVEVRCFSSVLLENLLLNVANEYTRIVRTETAFHRNACSLLVIVAIEGEGIKNKDELGKAHQAMGRWLQLSTFVEEVCERQ